MAMKLLITHPRSGSKLCAKILGIDCGFGGFYRYPDKPKSINAIYDRLIEHKGLWTHRPYTEEFVDRIREWADVECYILLRDPRDIIISMVYDCIDKPHAHWDYKLNGEKVSNLSVTKRIWYFIDELYEGMVLHDKYRTSGVGELIYYRDIINHPLAETFTEHKRLGIVGSHITEMSKTQRRIASKKYERLIESWA